jgi:hypothetical protein
MPKISALDPIPSALTGAVLIPVVFPGAAHTNRATLDQLTAFTGTGQGSGGGDNGTPNALPLSGGIMTGPLVLFQSPQASFEAATKSYVDSSISALPLSAAVVRTGDTMTGPLANSGSFTLNQAALDLRSAVIGTGAHAIWLGATGDIALDSGGSASLGYDETNGNFFFAVNGAQVFTVSVAGDVTGTSLTGTSSVTMALGEPGQELVGRGPASAPAWIDKPWINAEDPANGTVGDGIADDTLALQTALNKVGAGGGVVTITKPHVISAALKVSPGTSLDGRGGSLIASTSWPTPLSSNPAIDPGYAMLTNLNFSASSISDTDITVEGLAFDWTALQTAMGGTVPNAAAIRFRKVRRPLIRAVRTTAGASGIVMMGTQGSKIVLCTVSGTNGDGILHMEAPSNAIVESNSVFPAAGTNSTGIRFTATDYVSTPGLAAVRCRARNNEILGPTGGAANATLAAIQFTAGATGCTISNSQAFGNTIDGQGAMKHGVFVSGAGVSSLAITNNQIFATSRTTGTDITVTANSSVVGGNQTDNPTSFASSTSVTGTNNSVWGYETTGIVTFSGHIKAAGYD